MPEGDYTLTCKIYSPNSKGSVSIFISDGTNQIVEYVQSDNIQNISVSVTNKAINGFRFSSRVLSAVVFIDDIHLITQ